MPLTNRKKPIPVSVGSHDAEQAYRSLIARFLGEGKIPQTLVETGRWIGAGEDAHADAVISYIRHVLERLAIANTGKPAPELKIYLSDQEGLAVGVMTQAQTPILVVGLGMMDFLIENNLTEDHLAGIFGHERFHLRRHEKWADLDNGRLEETVGDVHGVHESAKADYIPGALKEVFQLLQKEQEKKGYSRSGATTFAELMDEHPALSDRIRNTDLALAGLQLKKRLQENRTEIPADIRAHISRTRYVSPFDRFKLDHGYDTKTPVEKLDVLARWWHETLDQTDPYILKQRLYESLEDAEALRGIPEICAQAWPHLLAFLEKDRGRYLEVEGCGYQHFYTDVDHFWAMRRLIELMSPIKPKEPDTQNSWSNPYNPGQSLDSRIYAAEIIPPDFQRLKTQSDAFRKAQTREEAVAAARGYAQAVAELEKYRPGLETLDRCFKKETKHFTETEFEWPVRRNIREQMAAQNTAELPWRRQLCWALGAEEATPQGREESTLIASTLLSLGCSDPRLKEGIHVRLFDGHGYKFEDLTFDESGYIVALTPSKDELNEQYRKRFQCSTAAELYAREYDRETAREQSETVLVASTDWEKMGHDIDGFWQFVEEHAAYLCPEKSVAPGKFPFAEAFMEKLETLVSADPATWKPACIEFLTGFPSREKSAELRRKKLPPEGARHIRYDEDKGRQFTLPYFLADFDEKHFGYKAQDIHVPRGILPDGHPMQSLLLSWQDKRRSEQIYVYEKDENGQKSHKLRYQYMRQPRKIEPEKHEVAILPRIDARHPYLRALLRLDPAETVITSQARGNLALHFRCDDPNARQLERYFCVSPRRIFNYAAPRTAKYLMALRRKGEETNNHELAELMRSAQTNELARTLRRLDRCEPPRRFELSELELYFIMSDFGHFQNTKTANALRQELKELVDRQARRNRDIDFSADVHPVTLIRRYNRNHGPRQTGGYFTGIGHSVFMTRPELEKEYQEHIRARILAMPVAERADCLAEFMSRQIRDPQMRGWAVDSWVETTVENLGIDDGSDAYAARALELIEDAVYKFDHTQGLNCVTRLLDAIEAQKKVALDAKELLINVFGQHFLEQDGAMRTIESAISICSHNPELRAGFLKYITEPLSCRGTQAFARLLKQRATESDFVKNFYKPNDGSNYPVNLSPQQENMIVDNLHRNFWAMPFELRTVYLDRILFPTREEDGGVFDHAVNFVLDKVLPAGNKFSPQTREALLVYLDGCPPELRRVTFSAILATVEETTKKGGTLRPGQVLSYIAGRTGAAGGMLLQAAHSYLSGQDLKDPDMTRLRDDLADSKINFTPPFRWEVFERMDAALPQGHTETFAHVGPVLGAGSTAYVVACDKTSGEETALKLMREDVVPVADLQFERYGEAFKTLAARHDEYAPLPAMVDHARKLIQIACNGVIGARQIEYAQNELYGPLQIKINGDSHRFHVAAAVSAGPEYLEMERIHGAHLNDMPCGPEKCAASIAIEAAEVYRWLQGKATDKDCHGGQQGVDGTVIGRFDVGQIPFDPEKNCVVKPDADEKRALGRLLGLTLNDVLSGGNAVSSFVGSVSTKEWGPVKNYLVGEQRALLARMDVHAGFGKKPEQRAAAQIAILGAVLKTGNIDPEIFSGIFDTVAPESLKKIMGFATGAEKSAFEIKISDAAVATSGSALVIPAKSHPGLSFAQARMSSNNNTPTKPLRRRGATTVQLAF